MKRRTEITIETDRLVIVRGSSRSRGRRVNWCASCGKQVEMMTTDEAAILARVSARTIFRWVESGRVHYMETPEGSLLVCLQTLS